MVVGDLPKIDSITYNRQSYKGAWTMNGGWWRQSICCPPTAYWENWEAMPTGSGASVILGAKNGGGGKTIL